MSINIQLFELFIQSLPTRHIPSIGHNSDRNTLTLANLWFGQAISYIVDPSVGCLTLYLKTASVTAIMCRCKQQASMQSNANTISQLSFECKTTKAQFLLHQALRELTGSHHLCTYNWMGMKASAMAKTKSTNELKYLKQTNLYQNSCR